VANDMFFSIHTDQHIIDANGIFGYSHGYYKINENFSKFKYKDRRLKVLKNERSSNVQMFYMEPEWYNLKTMTSFRHPEFKKFYDHQYKIYGTYLEATKVWPHWLDAMKNVDEIWVGNKFSVDAIKRSKIKTPTYVFELGVDDIWQPYKRGGRDKIRFLHVDSGSLRKRADLVLKAFIELFGNNQDVELTLKFHTNENTTQRNILELFYNSNVKKIYETFTQDQMYELYKKHDILVYPSEGEGFGLIPLQALATGMPVISTSVWCDYDKYFNGNIVKSKMGKTEYTGYFEGDVILPEYRSIVHLMKLVYDDIQNQCDYFYNQAQDVIDEYNWQNKSSFFLNSFIKRVGVDMLNPVEKYVVKSEYIVFTGNNVYITPNGIKFSPQSRLCEVDEVLAKGLLQQNCFRKASRDEIDGFFI